MRITALTLSYLVAVASTEGSGVPAQCSSDGLELCQICILNSGTALIQSTKFPPKCASVEDGSWDNDLKRCIEGGCASSSSCVQELQQWIDAPTVDVDAITGVTSDGIVCNKAGGNEAMDDDGKRCEQINPPLDNNGGRNYQISSDPNTGKVFIAQCVDVNNPSLTTAICISEDDCSEYGKFGFYPKVSDNTVSNEDKDEDKDEDDDEAVEDEDNDESSAKAVAANAGILFSTSLLYFVWF